MQDKFAGTRKALQDLLDLQSSERKENQAKQEQPRKLTCHVTGPIDHFVQPNRDIPSAVEATVGTPICSALVVSSLMHPPSVHLFSPNESPLKMVEMSIQAQKQPKKPML